MIFLHKKFLSSPPAVSQFLGKGGEGTGRLGTKVFVVEQKLDS